MFFRAVHVEKNLLFIIEALSSSQKDEVLQNKTTDMLKSLNLALRRIYRKIILYIYRKNFVWGTLSTKMDSMFNTLLQKEQGHSSCGHFLH